MEKHIEQLREVGDTTGEDTAEHKNSNDLLPVDVTESHSLLHQM